MSNAATQPAPTTNETRAGWWAAFALASMKVAHKLLGFWWYRTSQMDRVARELRQELKEQTDARLADLEQRISQLEGEKTALQEQNRGQGERISALEKELIALRNELQAVTAERDALREQAKRDGK